jgi:pilus assembly protein CpaB
MLRVIVRIAMIGLFALAALLVGRMLGDEGAEQAVVRAEPVTLVRVAYRDLVVGSFLDDSEAPFAEYVGALSDDLVTQGVEPERDVLGAVVITPIAAGQPILRSKLLLPGEDGFLAAVLHPGMRAVSIAVDPVSGNAGHVFPGDRVDLILTQSLSSDDDPQRMSQRWASETILEDVRVIAVDQSLSSDLTTRDPGRPAHTITLEVSQRDGEKVALAADLGRLSLSLRSLARANPDEVASTSFPESGKATGARSPTWASDVSAVIRTLAGGHRPHSREKSPPPTVRVFRGKSSETLSP